ncbi:MAG: hypothetical protein ACFFBW_16665 [Promethearchaeota archaeon]
MENLEKILDSNDPEKINDFLISLSKNPEEISSDLFNFILKNLDSNTLEKIKMNFIFLLGEIGKIKKIDDNFYTYLIDSYFDSDRWVRDEILGAFIKISYFFPPNEDLVELLSFAINEDYFPLKKKALDLLNLIEKVPLDIINKLFKNLDVPDSVIVDKIMNIFKKNIKNQKELMEFLNYSENYKVLNNSIIRTLLINYVYSINNLSELRSSVQNCNWNEKFKNLLINESKIYEKILLKRA